MLVKLDIIIIYMVKCVSVLASALAVPAAVCVLGIITSVRASTYFLDFTVHLIYMFVYVHSERDMSKLTKRKF